VAVVALYDRRVDGIDSREWLVAKLDSSATISEIATAAGVSRQSVYKWIERHDLPIGPRQKLRPSPEELATLYNECRSTKGLGEQLGIAKETARRWLVDAGIERGWDLDLDANEVRRKRRDGATIAELAAEYRVGIDTIRRRLDPTWGR